MEMRVDCDEDAIWIRVEQHGPGAHTGRRSCFYRVVPLKQTGAIALQFRDAEKTFDPNAVYDRSSDRRASDKLARASSCRARSRCGQSHHPAVPTVPAPGLSANA
jgi:hypothetical protein